MARLVTDVMVETHDEWQVVDRHYLSETSMAQLRGLEVAADTAKPRRESVRQLKPSWGEDHL